MQNSFRRTCSPLRHSLDSPFHQAYIGAPIVVADAFGTKLLKDTSRSPQSTLKFGATTRLHGALGYMRGYTTWAADTTACGRAGCRRGTRFTRLNEQPNMCSQSSADGQRTDSGLDMENSYRPGVSTWGVFPRPRNISQAFGGGRSIPLGGMRLNDESSQEREERLKSLLEHYRGKRTGSAETTEEKTALLAALESAERMLQAGDYQSAHERLATVAHIAKVRGEFGGKVLLQIALCKDALGLRDDARMLYERLQSSPEPDIRDSAKQLVFSFHASNWMRISSTTGADERHLIHDNAKLHIPTLEGLNSRYDTTFFVKSERRMENRQPPRFWIKMLKMLQSLFSLKREF